MATEPVAGNRLATTRRTLQRVATHVLARARADHGGRFGLRVTATGFGTPPFGPADTVVRLAGTHLVREDQTAEGNVAGVFDLTGRSLVEAAAFVGVDLTVPFAPGADAPPVGDPGEVLELDRTATGTLLGWFGFGAKVVDLVLPALRQPTVAQLWPEHFDLGLSATTGRGGANLGVSPGDDTIDEPYLYVAPWEQERPGDREFWNTGFGAVLTRSAVDGPDALETGAAFLRRGLDLLDGG